MCGLQITSGYNCHLSDWPIEHPGPQVSLIPDAASLTGACPPHPGVLGLRACPGRHSNRGLCLLPRGEEHQHHVQFPKDDPAGKCDSLPGVSRLETASIRRGAGLGGLGPLPAVCRVLGNWPNLSGAPVPSWVWSVKQGGGNCSVKSRMGQKH